MTTPTIPSLANELKGIKQALAELTAEQARLPGELYDASRAPDAARLITLRRRADELPYLIFVERVKVKRLEIAICDAQMEAAAAQRPAAKADVARLHEQMELLEKELATAQAIAAGIDSDLQFARQRRAQFERELDGILAEADTSGAPVVRSLPHAPSR